MKKIIALLAVFALIFSLCFTKPVKAESTTWSLPFSKIETLLDIAQQLFSGAEVNLAEISGQMLGLYDYILAYEDYIDENGIFVPTLTYDQAQALQIGLSSLSLAGEDVLTIDSDLTIPIKSSDIANFIGYRADWIKRYRRNISDSIVVNPDENYISLINIINNDSTFIFGSFSYSNNVVSPEIVLNSPYNASWVKAKGTNDIHLQTYPSPYITANINGNETDGYYVTYSGFSPSSYTSCSNNTRILYTTSNNILMGQNIASAYYYLHYWVNTDNLVPNNYYQTLTSCLTSLGSFFRNINIYVNGIPWSIVDSNFTSDPFIQLGAIPLGDLGTTTFPVYTLDKEGDLGLDVAAFADWLDSIIKSGATALSLEDLITDGIPVVDTITGERTITEDDEEDVAKVIAGVKATTAPTGSPTPTPDSDDDKKTPILKIIPPILELPDSIWPDGGRDTTVLAQIIHSTDVIMPDDIMIILWSIFGVMVIGGLLMILHK